MECVSTFLSVGSNGTSSMTARSSPLCKTWEGIHQQHTCWSSDYLGRGATGMCSLVIWLMHHRAWRSASLASASSSAFISWAITVIAFGFAWKEIKAGGRRGKRLQQTLEFITISIFSQLLYSCRSI